MKNIERFWLYLLVSVQFGELWFHSEYAVLRIGYMTCLIGTAARSLFFFGQHCCVDFPKVFQGPPQPDKEVKGYE